MIIGIDASMIIPSKAGIGYFAHSILFNLIKTEDTNEYIIYTNNTKNLVGLSFDSRFRIVELLAVTPNLKWMWKVYTRFKSDRIDLFLSMSNLFFGLLSNKTLTIIHDLSPIKYPHFFSKKGALLFKLEFKILIKKAKLILTVSESVKDEIIEYGKVKADKIYNIGEGLHEWAYHDKDLERNLLIKNKYNLPDKYFLSISTLEPRKNYIKIIEAYSIFSKSNPDWYYVIGGKKGWFFDEIFSTVKKLKLEKKVIFLGYIPEEDLAALFDEASGFIYLSFYEGFGLPLLEAYSRKIPILCSDIKVFKELNLDNSFYVDPKNIDMITERLYELKDIKVSINDISILKRYNWGSTINILRELFKILKKY